MYVCTSIFQKLIILFYSAPYLFTFIKINHDQFSLFTAPLITSCLCISQSRITFMISGKKRFKSNYIQIHRTTPITTIYPYFLSILRHSCWKYPAPSISKYSFNVHLRLHHQKIIYKLHLQFFDRPNSVTADSTNEATYIIG